MPPSPPEVYEFNVPKIPLIAVIRKDGEKIGEMVRTRPQASPLRRRYSNYEVAQIFNRH